MKSRLRQILKKRRKNLPPDLRYQKSLEIQRHLTANELFQKAKTILTYVSTDEEVDTRTLIQNFLERKSIVVPTVDPQNEHLELYHLKRWEELTEGHFGVLEIHHNDRIACHPEHIDLILVPGIAFDPFGHRIGYGKGYYDTLLKEHPAPTIGLAFSEQIVDKIPTDPHDIPIKTIITENGPLTLFPNPTT